MIGSEFLKLVSNWSNYVSVEDFADKWNFLFTPSILILCTTVVAVKQYLLSPIECFIPSQVSGTNFESYMENLCWVQGTYPVPVDSQFTNSPEFWQELESKKLLYYQWVPFILGLQTVMFYIPRVVWLMVATQRTGTDVQHLVAQAADAATADGEKREKSVKHVAASLEQLLFMHREYRTGGLHSLKMRIYRCVSLLVASKRLGTGLTVAYLCVKLLYLVNAIGQVYLMQSFLRLGVSNYSSSLFGLQIFLDVASGRDWQYTMVFPRVTFCRTSYAILGGTQTYLAQCVLPVNMLNEKIYIFLWFWVALGICITALSVPLWLCRMLNLRSRSRFVRRYLRLRETRGCGQPDKARVDAFVTEFLRHDGSFLLRMMQMNAGDLITGDVVRELFGLWRQKYQGRDFRADPPAFPFRLHASAAAGRLGTSEPMKVVVTDDPLAM